VSHVEFAEDTRQVVSDDLFADEDALCDFGIAEATGEMPRNVELPRGELVESRTPPSGFPLRSLLPGEFFERFAKARPGRFGLEKNVIATLQGDELCAGYAVPIANSRPCE
jgi:hypothetical protein